MTTRIVLAMHGMPPRDFSDDELMELVKLHRMIEKLGHRAPLEMRNRFDELDSKIRNWLRTGENDPFWAASNALAKELQSASGFNVVVGYNEFCGPNLTEALDAAAGNGAKRVVVVTPMMTPGGEHSEEDIPAAILSARERFVDVEFIYAWPFPLEDVASFLTHQITKFENVES